MVQELSDLSLGHQQTRDELNPEVDVTPVLKKFQEDVEVIGQPTMFKKQNIGDQFIVSHPINGVLGVANGIGGTQIVLGNSKIGPLSLFAVVNSVNTYIEMFKTITFKHVSTTANWNTTTTQIEFTAGQFAVSEKIAFNAETYITATLKALGTGLTNLMFELSSDGGTTYETVTNNVAHVFVNADTTGLRFRITASGVATITRLDITYSTT